MHIAVCSPDMEERYTLSRLIETVLHGNGILPEISLFPMLPDFVEAVTLKKAVFTLAFATDARDTRSLASLCKNVPVVLIGDSGGGPRAFDVGAIYYLETPVTEEKLKRTLKRFIKETPGN